MKDIKTLGELKASGYQPRSVKEELRQNLIQKLKRKETVFEGKASYHHLDDAVAAARERRERTERGVFSR